MSASTADDWEREARRAIFGERAPRVDAHTVLRHVGRQREDRHDNRPDGCEQQPEKQVEAYQEDAAAHVEEYAELDKEGQPPGNRRARERARVHEVVERARRDGDRQKLLVGGLFG